ncbi:MAG TPA: cytochrome P450 [Propionibacteriaceae bacterium]|nr:cytochrome P450 [Propionibacteriaceae bacterium]
MTAAQRRLVPPGERSGPPVERVGGSGRAGERGERWVIRSYDTARQLLRDPEATRQAGFGADQVTRAGVRMRPPVLYLEGAEHRAQRKAAARFFAPKVIEGYRELIERLSGELVARLRTDRSVDLSRLSLALAVQVVARVVGLTSSSPTGMARRLDAFFAAEAGGPLTPRSLLAKARNRSALLRFYYLDVKPAIRSRRKQPREDVISQLLASGFTDLDILTECVTYGAAGMATTREFITVAAWHLLSDPELLARYRAGDSEQRTAILSETLRLEPVIGHLFRTTSTPVTVDTSQGPEELPAGTLIDLDIRAANADPSVVGTDPLGLCPARDLGATPPTMLSFGDGHHKCPGGPLAILESEIFLSTLFRLDVVLEHPPRVRWNALTQGYDLDSCAIRLAS